MNKNLPIRLFTIVLFFFIVPHVYAIDECECGQKVPENQGLNLVYLSVRMDLEWYSKEKDQAKFEDIVIKRVNYLYWNKKYYATIVPIYGSENINEILRQLKEKYGPPIHLHGSDKIWINEGRIITFQRFSLHLGQTGIVCEDLLKKRLGVKKPDASIINRSLH